MLSMEVIPRLARDGNDSSTGSGWKGFFEWNDLK